jgi:hypothetical protein
MWRSVARQPFDTPGDACYLQLPDCRSRSMWSFQLVRWLTNSTDAIRSGASISASSAEAVPSRRSPP